jgi:hypothetical protein
MLVEVVMMASQCLLGYDLALGIGLLFVQSMVACEEAERCPYAHSMAPARMMEEEVS